MKYNLIINQYIWGFLMLIFILGSCTHEKKAEKEETASFVLNDSIVKIIKIDTVKMRPLEGRLDLNGEVSFNENTVVKVMSLVTGTVTDVHVQLGDYVKQGDMLATIKSSEVAKLQSDFSSATAELTIAKKNLEVNKELAQKGVSSEKDILEAQQAVNKAQASLESVNNVLSIIGGTISGNHVQIKSPVSGYVVARNVNPNQVIGDNSGDPMFIVSDLKQVWVIANVYEADIEKIKKDEEVTITTVAYQNKIFKGKINFISNVLDPENKTMKIRIVLDNPNNDLKPDMFAKVSLLYKDNLEVASIPRDAIVFDNNKNYAVIYENPEKISVRLIELYPASKDFIFVKSGLKPGEKIISKNQLIIYNAIQSM